jgi:hypothetical protein
LSILRKAVEKAINSLLARTSFPEKYINAPHIRAIGEELQAALNNDEIDRPELRPDVQAFALKMAAVMDEKHELKGGYSDMPLVGALGQIEGYLKRLQEYGMFGRPEEIRRILIHVANYAMIAESKL